MLKDNSLDIARDRRGIAPIVIILIIAIISALVAGGGAWYFGDQQAKKQKSDNNKRIEELEKQIKDLEKQKEELEDQSQNGLKGKTGTKVAVDMSSGENVIKTYYKALNAHDWDTAYSCYSDELKQQNTLDQMKAGWQNIKTIRIKTLTQRYVAASARIYEAMVEEEAVYYDPNMVAGGDTHFINTTDTTYKGDWRITQIATSPINLD